MLRRFIDGARQRTQMESGLAKFKFVLLALFMLFAKQSWACTEYVVWGPSPPPEEYIYGSCSSNAEAYQACSAFAVAHNYRPTDVCGLDHSGPTPDWVAGNLWAWWDTQKVPFALARYYFPPILVPDKNTGCHSPSPCVGDPVNAGVGNKLETKNEYTGSGAFPLRFTWTYNSLNGWPGFPAPATILGRNRTHSYSWQLLFFQTGATIPIIVVRQPNGQSIRFTQPQANGVWVVDSDQEGKLIALSGSSAAWQFEDSAGGREWFDANGRLTALFDSSGYMQSVAYDASGRISSVTDPNGRVMTFGYNSSNLLSALYTPDAGQINFAYSATNDLTQVTYPGSTSVQYLYDESSYSSASARGLLTGVIDENGVRYSTTTYNSNGWGTSTVLSGGVEPYSIAYLSPDISGDYAKSSIGLPLGATQNTEYVLIAGVVRPRVATTSCSGCSDQVTTYVYDANGRVSTKAEGSHQTDYNYNDRGLITSRVDASNASGSNANAKRTTNTVWNANFRVPDSRTVLNAGNATESLTKWSYNTRGQVLSRCEIDPAVSGASSYTCGSSANAPAGVRQTSYTYCEQAGVTAGTCPLIGLMLSIDGPRTDVVDVTTYTYYQTTDLSGCATIGGACHNKGDLLQVTNALSQSTTYISYDKNGRVTRQSDPNGTLTDFTYHPRGWLLTRTVRANVDGSSSANDATITFAYDNVGNVTQITQPDQTYLHYVYDAAHRLTDIYDSASPSNYLNGNRIHYTLDAAGNRTKEDTKDPSGTLKRTLSRQYDQLNHLTKALNAANAAVQTSQNPAETAPSGITYTNGYDGNGNAIYSVDGNGVGTEQQYDPLNRLIKTLQDHAGTGTTKDTTTQYAYDARDNLRSVNDPDGLVTNYTYDGLNNLNQLDSPDTGTSSYTYDAAGNRIAQTDARGVQTTYAYDALNRLTGISYPTSSLNVTYGYDQPNSITGCTTPSSVGHLTTMTDSSGSTAYCYGRRGNLTRKTQVIKGGSAGMPSTATNWALASNGGVPSASSTYTGSSGFPLAAINDGDRTGRTWGSGGGWNDNTMNAFPDWVEIDLKSPQSIGSVVVVTLQDNPASAIDPTNTTTFSLYGVTAFHVQALVAGNWVTVGTVTGNNLVKRTVTFTPVVTSAIRVYSDDSADHQFSRVIEVEAWSSDVTLVTQMTYTLADRVASITYPTGASASYTRDVLGRVTAVSYKASPTAAAVTLASNVTYYPFGPVNTVTYGNGRTLTKTYDQDYAIQTVVSSDVNGMQLDPTIDVMGNMINNSLGIGVSPPTHSYSYDPLYRLTKVMDANSNPLATYSYNNTGDRLSKSSAGQSSTYTYVAGTHRLSSVGGVTRTYDNNGNVLSGAGGNAGNQWTYDNRNRMASAQGIAGGVATSAVYNYNAKGERVVKSVTGGVMQSTVFLYNEGGQLLGEYAAGSSSVQGEYVYLDGIPLGYVTAGTLYYVETDQLGTPHRLIRPGATTASDTMVWKWASTGDAYGHVNMFGELAPGTQTVLFNLRFPGQYYDAETGVHYNYFRDYDPNAGRYLQSDPMGQGEGVDTYSYVEGNPLNGFDPTGLWKVYGYWCGPDWTGGWKRSWNELTPWEQEHVHAPKNPLDSLCMHHDICYGNCGQDFPCDMAARSRCLLTCDRRLIDGAKARGFWGNTVAAGIATGKPYKHPEDASPKPDPKNCPCQQ